MGEENLFVSKSSGAQERLSKTKLIQSLRNSGADQKVIEEILNVVRDKYHQGMSTEDIYDLSYKILMDKSSLAALKYPLKKALFELGPDGFYFEQFIQKIFTLEGFKTQGGIVMQGKCVTHEIDVLAEKNNRILTVECKFHSEAGRNSRVKIPLYINSRYQDLISNLKNDKLPNEAWIVTNTRFTKDAVDYSKCVGIHLLSWDFPSNNSLKEKIEKFKLYPITLLSQLTAFEKGKLLEADCLLCSELEKRRDLLKTIGVTGDRAKSILDDLLLILNKTK